MKLIKAMITVAGLTGLSRIAGFVRDIMTAAILGAGPIADAFFVALKLPNLFRRVTAEGAFSVSFVPLYSETLSKDGEAESSRFASEALSLMLWALLCFTLIALMIMPWVIHVIAPGFVGDPLRYELAVDLARITFPYLLLMSITALLGGVLNAHDRFAPFAAAPIFFNLSLILALLLSSHFKTAGHAMAWGVLIAGFIQLGLLYFFIKRLGLKIRVSRPVISARIKRLFKLMLPGIIGAGVLQINLFVDLIIASFLQSGSISYLYYADRLNQLPLGVIGLAVGTALLPMLSKAISKNDIAGSQTLFNRALEICALLAIPAAVGLFMASTPIVMTLFHHGEFTVRDAGITASVLTAYAAGMPAYILSKVYASAYWAKQDTITPVKASIVATVVNICVSLYLVMIVNIGVIGIAIGTSIAGWLQLIILFIGMRNEQAVKLEPRLIHSLFKILGACALLATYLYLMQAPLSDIYTANGQLFTQVLYLLALVGSGIIIYSLAVILSGAIKIQELKSLLRRE